MCRPPYDPSQPPQGAPPPGPPPGVDPQQWWAWWWRTYGGQWYQWQQTQAWPQPQAWQRPGETYPAPPYGYAQPVYFPVQPQWQQTPRRRRRGMRALVAFLILLVVVSPVALFAVGYYAGDLEVVRGGDPAVVAGPTPAEGTRFDPNTAQSRYFYDVAFDPDSDRRAVKWAVSEVDVVLEGDDTAEDRRIVDEILETVNETVDGPEFVYSADDPEVVIAIVDHETFASKATDDGEAIGWCNSRYSAVSYTLWDAEIYVDDSPEYRDVRSAILYHEFGHALGLTDTETWDGAIMYYMVDDPSRYTALDLAAIAMLYDGRVDAGDAAHEAADVWPQE